MHILLHGFTGNERKAGKAGRKKEQKRLTRENDIRGKKGTAKSSVLDEDILCMFSAIETRTNAHSVLGRMARTDACRVQHAR